ncbi:DUF4160 domain-containing protein [Janthinobacterium sp.]|uniref:DUF4160 domain-containing protein n=1 Tax=Janthinobacterium sp. TaxID=1871054 RepID=UPI00293D311B|nr:DUF4160 domain-containing protein [Janthinobacterium sp.]
MMEDVKMARLGRPVTGKAVDETPVESHEPQNGPPSWLNLEAIIDIRNLTMIEGGLPRRALSLVHNRAELHRAELLAGWQLYQDMQNPKPIAPLE